MPKFKPGDKVVPARYNTPRIPSPNEDGTYNVYSVRRFHGHEEINLHPKESVSYWVAASTYELYEEPIPPDTYFIVCPKDGNTEQYIRASYRSLEYAKKYRRPEGIIYILHPDGTIDRYEEPERMFRVEESEGKVLKAYPLSSYTFLEKNTYYEVMSTGDLRKVDPSEYEALRTEEQKEKYKELKNGTYYL